MQQSSLFDFQFSEFLMSSINRTQIFDVINVLNIRVFIALFELQIVGEFGKDSLFRILLKLIGKLILYQGIETIQSLLYQLESILSLRCKCVTINIIGNDSLLLNLVLWE